GESVGRDCHRAGLVVRVRVVHRGRAAEWEQRVVVHRLTLQSGVGRADEAGALQHHHAVVGTGRVRTGAANHPHAGCLRRSRVGPGQVDPVATAMGDGGDAGQLHGHTPAWLMTTTRMPFAYAGSAGMTGTSFGPSTILPVGSTAGTGLSSRRNSVMFT